MSTQKEVNQYCKWMLEVLGDKEDFDFDLDEDLYPIKNVEKNKEYKDEE